MTETTALDTTGVGKTQHEPHPLEGGELESEMPSAPVQVKKNRLKLPQKKALSILLVGETGSGKTSFLSLVLNLLKGNGPFELVEQHDTTAESGLDTTQSQTTKARVYCLTTAEGTQFQIIDTPGLADTRGMDKNNKNRELILRAVKEFIKRIDAVMLVINGRNQRLTVSTSYTLQTLATLFPRSIKNNIGIIFTNTEDEEPNFNMNALPPELRTTKHWCVDNPLARYQKHGDRIRELTESERRDSTQVRRLIEDYNAAVKTLNDWLKWLDNQEAVPTTAIIELYHKSNDIESRLLGVITSLENLPITKRALEGLIKDIKKAEESQTSLVEVRDTVPPETWQLVKSPTFNTICGFPNCHSSCHDDCNLELGDPETLGGWCRAFKVFGLIPNWCISLSNQASAKCSKCSHRASVHRKSQEKFEREPNEAYQKILQDLQGAQLKTDRLREGKADIEQRIKTIEQSIEESKLEIPRLVEEMNNVSLSPNYAGYIRSAIELFELHQKHLQGCADSDQELIAVNSGITMFKNHLALLKNKASDWVTSFSSGVFGN